MAVKRVLIIKCLSEYLMRLYNSAYRSVIGDGKCNDEREKREKDTIILCIICGRHDPSFFLGWFRLLQAGTKINTDRTGDPMKLNIIKSAETCEMID